MSNLKPAPFPLTPSVVAKLLEERAPHGKGVVRVPLVGKIGERERG